MKVMVTDWEAAFQELARWASHVEVGGALVDELPAKHTREVPDGLMTRMRAELVHWRVRHGPMCNGCGDVADATPEVCAALDSAAARVVELENSLRRHVAVNAELERRAVALNGRLQQEQAVARQRDLQLTDALCLLDEATEALSAEGRGGLAARITGFLNAPTSVPEPTPDPRDALRWCRAQCPVRSAAPRLRCLLEELLERYEGARTGEDSPCPEPTPDPRDAFVCFGLGAFSSGELKGTPQDEVFRQHLPGCAACRDGLETSMQLDALGGCQATGEQDPAEWVTEERLTEVEARATAELTGDITASDAQQNYGPIMPVLLAKDARDLAAEVRRLRLGRGGAASGLDSNGTGTESRHRREAEHELATERLVEWCRWRARELPTASPELKELLERYEATRPNEQPKEKS